MRAAEKLSRATIWDSPRQAQPTRFRIQADRRQTGEPATAAIGKIAPFTPDGSMSLGYEIPGDRQLPHFIRGGGRRLRSPDNGRYINDVPEALSRLMTMMLDGERIATKAVEAANGFERSEQFTRRIEAGTRGVWLGFIDSESRPMNPNSITISGGFGWITSKSAVLSKPTRVRCRKAIAGSYAVCPTRKSPGGTVCGACFRNCFGGCSGEPRLSAKSIVSCNWRSAR